MEITKLKALLSDVRDGTLDIENALQKLKELPYEDLGYVKIDHHRALRVGFPEVIYCEGKKTEYIKEIFQKLSIANKSILATRASKEAYEAVKSVVPEVQFHEDARIIVLNTNEKPELIGEIAVVTAGTADIPVAEEAAVTAEAMGNKVSRIYDVGVAGIHRLFSRLEDIKAARVIIVVAGMEGALASVVGGLVDKPVVAVPTSIGYGASFGGLAALLTMLNSCSSGIGVVNIDNGFGAGFLASQINRLGK